MKVVDTKAVNDRPWQCALSEQESSVLPLCRVPPHGQSTIGAAAEPWTHNPPNPMSDWFKVHNDLLDEDNFQFALTRTPTVGTVYLAMLCKASKIRCSVIPWSEQALVGMSHRLQVGPGIINEAINALEEAGYLAKDGNGIRVTHWNDLQSPYCKGAGKPAKKHFKQTSKKLTSNLQQTSKKLHLEERREEEIREEKKILDQIHGKDPEALNKKTHYGKFITGSSGLAGEVTYLKTGQEPADFIEPSDEDPFPP